MPTQMSTDPEKNQPNTAWEAPPSAGTPTEKSGPPPTYQSLYGELKEVKSPTGFFHFLGKALGFLLGKCCAIVVIAFLSTIPISMIVIGVQYKDKCPVERMIPIYLIVGGVFGLVKTILNIVYRGKRRLDGEPESADPSQVAKPNPFDGILNLFLFAWFIAGSVWVYRAYPPSFKFDEDSTHFCHAVPYIFTFTIITLQYVFMLFIGCYIALHCFHSPIAQPIVLSVCDL